VKYDTDNNLFGREIAASLKKIEQHLAAIRDGHQNTPQEWLTVNDVAQRLKVSRDTIERLIAYGQLRAAKLDTERQSKLKHRYRIHKDWVDQFMFSNVKANGRSSNKHDRSRRRHCDSKTDFIG
jgi:excisionase family DNA binding protein